MTMIPTSPLFVNEERLAAGLFGISLQMGKKEIVQIGDFPKQKTGVITCEKNFWKKALCEQEFHSIWKNLLHLFSILPLVFLIISGYNIER